MVSKFFPFLPLKGESLITITIRRLKEDERAYIKARLEKDQGRSALERRITPKDVLNCFKDYKYFLGGFMYFGLIVPACKTSPAHFFFVQADREHRDNASVLPCSPQKDNADLEKYKQTATLSSPLASSKHMAIHKSAPNYTAFRRGHVPSSLPSSSLFSRIS